MFPNGSQDAASLNGVTRLGDTVVEPHTVLLGGREYVAYVWGKRMPRTNEAIVRQAAQDLEIQRADLGDPSPLFLLAEFQRDVRETLATEGAAEVQLARVAAAVERYDQAVQFQRAPLPMWQAYLNRVMCGLVERLSPLEADRLEMADVSKLLGDLRFPGFWKGERVPLPNGQSETSMPTISTSPIGSTLRPESPASAESVSPPSGL